MVEEKRKNLGRGLSALLGEEDKDYAALDKVRAFKTVPVEFIHPGSFQPRHGMDEERLRDLAESIKSKGVLQPILVRRHPNEANSFEIIAGERRWRAAQMAQLHEVPVVIREFSDQEALEIALVENLQRQDLSPLEEAEGYRRLMEEFAHTQEGLAEAVGKSRSHVANMMRLLALPDPVKGLLDRGDLTAGHARALLTTPNPEELAREVVQRGLNVRQTEKLAQSKAEPRKPREAVEKDADTLALERDLTNLLGLRVEIKFRGGGGALTLHYGSLEQLDDILHRLSHGARGGAMEEERVEDQLSGSTRDAEWDGLRNESLPPASESDLDAVLSPAGAGREGAKAPEDSLPEAEDEADDLLGDELLAVSLDSGGDLLKDLSELEAELLATGALEFDDKLEGLSDSIPGSDLDLDLDLDGAIEAMEPAPKP